MRSERVFKDRRRNAYLVVLGLILLFWGVSKFQSDNTESQDPKIQAANNELPEKRTTFTQTNESIRLNLMVELREDATVGERAEIWIKSMGSWYLNNKYDSNDQINKFGSVSTTTPNLEVGKNLKLYFYPDGRDKNEIALDFKLSSEFCSQGCARDALRISVFNNKVTFFGLPIKEAHGDIEIEKNR
ncbi:hypothetical protein [Gracilimonas sediminicola]|uniref:Uncharacterized protein n=1 Tax=Gracilimonas sediminicola TaxID=2952158 RepID=A0A9X2L3K7_9BACT|nr:hypothetical protein [Gracilimonas sediminicola]MCP9291652.1 hypothetical protein [Gracilimonas sediminicola]